MQKLYDKDRYETDLMIKSTENLTREKLELAYSAHREMHNENAKKKGFMYWVKAIEELPPNLQQVYLKIKWNKRLIRQVGFYSVEQKLFHTKSGDTFKKKYVQWLSGEFDQTF